MISIYIIKSDQGDGGWSAHDRDEEDADGIAPALAYGVAKWDEARDDYDWPTPAMVAGLIDANKIAQ